MLNDKIAIITGGTRGIGLETVRTFAKNGAKTILFGSRQETVDKAIAKLQEEGLEIDGYCPNLNNYSEIEQTIAEILKKYGRIDILVNNAGMSADKPIENTSPEEIDKVIDLNLRAVLYLTKAVVPAMKQQKSGVILNTSSMVSIYGQPAGVAYPATKFAINGLTKSLARE